MKEENHAGWKLSRRATVTLVVVVVASASIIGVVYAPPFFNFCTSSTPIHFTIAMTNQGFNGSKTHTTDAWPVLNVARCQVVTVHLENLDTAEPHGFAITHYLDSGVQLRPGQTDDVTFTANRAGSFLVYCNVLCSIHLYMQNGRLNVT